MMDLKTNLKQICTDFLEWYKNGREEVLNQSKTITEIPDFDESTYPCIIWNENDFRTQLAFDFLKNNAKLPFKREDYHFQFKLKKNLFRFEQEVNERWNHGLSELKSKLGIKGGDIDLLIDNADRKDFPFLCCIEFKYFHYNLAGYARNYGQGIGKKERGDPVNEIKKGYDILKILHDCKLTKDFLVIVGDIYYNRRGENSEILNSIRDNQNIVYLAF